MGLCSHTYIGFYLDVKKKVENKIIKKVTYETEAGEIFDFPTKFSSESGLKTTKIEREQKVPIVYEGLNDYVNTLNGNDNDWYFDNYFQVPSYDEERFQIILNYSEDDFSVNIEEDDSHEIYFVPHVDSFIEKHSKIVNELIDFFGDVDIKYGVINYRH